MIELLPLPPFHMSFHRITFIDVFPCYLSWQIFNHLIFKKEKKLVTKFNEDLIHHHHHILLKYHHHCITKSSSFYILLKYQILQKIRICSLHKHLLWLDM